MTTLEKQMETIQKQLTQWARKAKKDYPEHLERSVRGAVDRLDPAGLARASEDVIATVTGNRKTARRARKLIEKTLAKAQRKAGTQHRARGRVLTCLAILVVIGVLGSIALRRAMRQSEPVAYRGSQAAVHPDTPVDPDLG